MQFLSSIAPFAEQYDAFILDLWGVIHDGSRLYPNVKECLQALKEGEKKIILLSNAPRRAKTVVEAMQRMGIEDTLYDAIITSGETAYQALAHPENSFFKLQGQQYVYVGLEKDRFMLEGLPYEQVEKPESAQFLLLSHSYTDNQPLSDFDNLLTRSLARNIPAICINPDLEVVRISGERVYCAGVIAEKYQSMGGEVVYFGKPHRAVYEQCFRILGDKDKSRIIAVGDSLKTDILGATKSHIKSVLVTGGVLRDEVGAADAPHYKDKCRELCARENVMPNYVIPAFNW